MTDSTLGFMSWAHREKIRPKNLRYASEYNGESDLRIACTQLSLSPSKSKKVLSEWCDLLPTLDKATRVYFYSKTPQSLFDAVTKMPSLEGLFIKWSGDGIKDFSSLNNLSHLRSLYLSGCTRLTSLDCLSNLNNLHWLQINDNRELSDISALGELVNLKGLILTGGRLYAGGKKGKIQSLDVLSNLQNLEYLRIGSLRIESEDLTPLTYLKKLKYLNISREYSIEEIAKVYCALKDCDHGLGAFLEDIDTCPQCDKQTLYIPWAKGKRAVCKHCASKRFHEVEQEFRNLVLTHS